MRWYRALVYRRSIIDTDETYNTITELQATGESILVRTAPYTSSEDATEGNRFDMIERTFLTKAAPSRLSGIDALLVQGSLYEVEGMSAGAPVTAMRVRRCKDGV